MRERESEREEGIEAERKKVLLHNVIQLFLKMVLIQSSKARMMAISKTI